MFVIEPLNHRMNVSFRSRSIHDGGDYSYSGLNLELATWGESYVSGIFAHCFGTALFFEGQHMGVRHLRPTQLLALDLVEGNT